MVACSMACPKGSHAHKLVLSLRISEWVALLVRKVRSETLVKGDELPICVSNIARIEAEVIDTFTLKKGGREGNIEICEAEQVLGQSSKPRDLNANVVV